MPKKIIITLHGPLQAKYGAGFPVLQGLFIDLVNADAVRNLITELVYIDTPETAARFGYTRPANFDEQACKNIVDEICRKELPEYLAIFGGDDVFPYQKLNNLLYKPSGGDPDEKIPSDLPYACDSPFSADPNSFTSPSRVVGRIPDLPVQDGQTGQGNIDFVTAVIEQITHAIPADPAACSKYFANSAYQWSVSTRQSLQRIFGNDTDMKKSPADNSGFFQAADIAALPHFFNLHGNLGMPIFYGQQGESHPLALKPDDLAGKITPGCFVAAECCYGTQLFENASRKSIAATYLNSRASVFMGSSTISYGLSEGQGPADLITRYFMINILRGASSGRALLSARQKFLSVSGPALNPHDLKTLAQFHILGDPAVQPVQAPVQQEMASTIGERRFNLAAKGIQLGLITPSIRVVGDEDTQGPVKDFLIPQDIQLPAGSRFNGTKTIFETSDIVNFDNINSVPTQSNSPGDNPLKTRYHIYQKRKILKSGINTIEALVVVERENRMLGYRRYLSK